MRVKVAVHDKRGGGALRIARQFWRCIRPNFLDPGQSGARTTLDGSFAVFLQAELAFEGLVDRLDPLPDATEVPVLVGRPCGPGAADVGVGSFSSDREQSLEELAVAL